MNIYVKNVPGLIGDFLGCLPALQDLSINNSVYIENSLENKGLYSLVSSSYNIFQLDFIEAPTFTIDINRAFTLADKNKLYMSQAFMPELGLPVPLIPPKADINYNYIPHNDIYFISPFARSLPPLDKWSRDNWIDLVQMNQDKQFMVLGNSKYDPYKYITGKNVSDYYDHNLRSVASMLKSSNGLISVVTGTSHLAFHLGVPNIVLNNQNMNWGRNPDGIHISTIIQQLNPTEVNGILQDINNK